MKRQLYKVNLYGSLRKDYGDSEIKVYGTCVKDVFRGLTSRFGDSFKDTILEGIWHITCGESSGKVTESDKFIEEREVEMPLQATELNIFPAVVGAGGKTGNILKIVVGVVLIVVGIAAIVLTGGIGTAGGISLIITGATLAIGGTMGLLSKPPSVGKYENVSPPDQRQSFIFNGAVNNTEQGVPVPLVYGIHLTGSTILSAGLNVEQL